MPAVLQKFPRARLVFYGNGEERDHMIRRAQGLEISTSVSFHGPISPQALSPILSSATASVASLSPVPANEYALATKIYSSLASGCPVIFTGVGPTIDFLNASGHEHAGIAVPYDVASTAAAMIAAAKKPLPPASRSKLAAWSAKAFSLQSIAERVVDECVGFVRG